ncbi:MAG: hypothetical protein CVV53_07770, partial [Spirochaetae bacterium HGW-Spirochaetae-9]
MWVVLLAGLLCTGLPAAAQIAFGAEVVVTAPLKAAPGDPLLCWLSSDRQVVAATATLKDASGKKLTVAESFYMPPQGEGF